MRVNLALAVAMLGAAMPYARAQNIMPNTEWRNDKGSDLIITDITADGVLTGTYINRAKDTSCKNTPYPVSGYVYGDKIVFSVRWKNSSEDCASLTSWAGYLANGRLVADWILVYTDSGLTHPFQMLGTDYFTPETSNARSPHVSR